jgi:two-component system, NarL family, sensor kinase
MPQEKQQIIWIVIIGSIVLLGVAMFVVSFLLYYTRKHNRNVREKLEMQSKFKQEILHTQLEIQEQTLKTISEEIHDNIGQMLSLAKLNLALADAETSNPHPMQQKISDSFQLVKKSLQDLRHLSHSLNTDYVSEMGLHRAIEYELEMISKTGVINVELQVEGILRRLDQQKELILFRIVQESLGNIIKHADATKIEISIQYLAQEIILSIHDNGKGMETSRLIEAPDKSIGMGIRNMKNRAQLIGATFTVTSSTSEGTTISLRLQE